VCNCPFTGKKGWLFIDCSCKGKLKLWVIDEDENPAFVPKCGQWIKADGYILGGTLYKIDGSTCSTFSCKGNTAQLDCCVNLAAKCLGKKCPYPAPPGSFPKKLPPPGVTPKPVM
jgi:hypothetical protein